MVHKFYIFFYPQTATKENSVKQSGGIQKVQVSYFLIYLINYIIKIFLKDWLDIQITKPRVVSTEEIQKVVSDGESSEGLTDSMVTCLQNPMSLSKFSLQEEMSESVRGTVEKSHRKSLPTESAQENISSILASKSSQDLCSEKSSKKKKIKKRKQLLSTEKSADKKHISDNLIITFNDDNIHDIENISLIAGFRNYMNNEQVVGELKYIFL